MRPKLAMPTPAYATFHVALHGHVDVVLRHARRGQRLCRETHHDLRSADHCDGLGGIVQHGGDQIGHQADPTAPVVGGKVDRGADAHAFRGRPAEQLPRIQDLVRRARPIDDVDAFQPVPVCERPVDDRTGWCEAQAAGDDHQMLADGPFDGPGGTQGAAHADPLPFRQTAHRIRDSAHGTDRLYKGVGRCRIAGDADRDLADAMGVKHGELPGGETEGLAVHRRHL